jgi:hypothetical protein
MVYPVEQFTPPQTMKLFEMGHPGVRYSYDGFALIAITLLQLLQLGLRSV